MSTELHLHIDRVVLDRDFAQVDRETLRRAVESELARRLAGGNRLPTEAELRVRVARLDGGRVRVQPGAEAEGLGRRVAERVLGGMYR